MIMAKKKMVSSKTHTQAQLNDYANQNNPNNKAYKARMANAKAKRKKNKELLDLALFYSELIPTDPMYYSNPYDFD